MAIFDKEATKYDAWYEDKKGSFVDEVETELALRMFTMKPGMKVLDVGCGTGNFSIKLAQAGCKVVGIDVSDEMLKIAEEKTRENGLDIEFHNMSVYDINFGSETFDAAFSMAAFEFVENTEAAVNEMFRVVKPGGEIFIGTINKDSKWGELYLSDYFQEKSVFKHAHFKTLEDLCSFRSEHLVSRGECLFVAPTADDEDFCWTNERQLSGKERGGYICALWRK